MKEHRVGIVGRTALVAGLLLSGGAAAGCTAEGGFASSTAAQPVGSTAVVSPEQQAQALIETDGLRIAQSFINTAQGPDLADMYVGRSPNFSSTQLRLQGLCLTSPVEGILTTATFSVPNGTLKSRAAERAAINKLTPSQALDIDAQKVEPDLQDQTAIDTEVDYTLLAPGTTLTDPDNTVWDAQEHIGTTSAGPYYDSDLPDEYIDHSPVTTANNIISGINGLWATATTVYKCSPILDNLPQ